MRAHCGRHPAWDLSITGKHAPEPTSPLTSMASGYAAWEGYLCISVPHFSHQENRDTHGTPPSGMELGTFTHL